jgi:hypothetical protein
MEAAAECRLAQSGEKGGVCEGIHIIYLFGELDRYLIGT